MVLVQGLPPRKFVETVELHVGLQNNSLGGDRQFNTVFQLRHSPRPDSALRSVCVFGDERRCAEAETLGLPWYSLDMLRELQRKQKNGPKKLIESFFGILVSKSVMKQIPRLLGPSLGKCSKFPMPLADGASLVGAVEALQRKTKWQFKKAFSLSVAVGHVQMSPKQLGENVALAVWKLISVTKDGWGSIKTMHLKSTMGPPLRIL